MHYYSKQKWNNFILIGHLITTVFFVSARKCWQFDESKVTIIEAQI